MGSTTAADIRKLVSGPVYLPDDPGYDEERAGFQTGYRHRPDVIVGAVSEEDVRHAADFANRRGLTLAVQATGHGLATPAGRGSLLITTGRMTGVRVDAPSRTAWLEAGVRAGRVVAEAARYGLAPVNGSAPSVGMVSYVLGGGVGLLGRRFGYAADRVRRARLVTPDARVLEVTAESAPELFWGLRGGGGDFGVVTGLEVELVPVERVYGGQLVFDGAHAEQVVRGWLRWTETVPEALTSSVTLLPYPDVPQLPRELRGRYTAQVQIAFDGAEEEGERLTRPMRSLGGLISGGLREMPYAESASIHNEPDMPHAYRGTNAMLGEAPDAAALRSVLELTGPSAPMMCVAGMRHLGGALARETGAPSAVPHRDAAYLLGVVSVPNGEPSDAGSAGTVRPADGGEPAGPEDEVRQLHRRVMRTVEPWTTGTCRNFLFGERPDTVRGTHEAEIHRRLTALKAALDPGNALLAHHNIPPTPAPAP